MDITNECEEQTLTTTILSTVMTYVLKTSVDVQSNAQGRHYWQGVQYNHLARTLQEITFGVTSEQSAVQSTAALQDIKQPTVKATGKTLVTLATGYLHNRAIHDRHQPWQCSHQKTTGHHCALRHFQQFCPSQTSVPRQSGKRLGSWSACHRTCATTCQCSEGNLDSKNDN